MSEMRCSFCGKGRREVRKLISGPGVFICDECVGMCNSVIDEQAQTEPKLPSIHRRLGQVVLDDWATICLDALQCRILWPLIAPEKRLLSRAHTALADLVPELFAEETAPHAFVVHVENLDRARELVRACGLFDTAEEVRDSSQGRAAIFRMEDGRFAALISG